MKTATRKKYLRNGKHKLAKDVARIRTAFTKTGTHVTKKAKNILSDTLNNIQAKGSHFKYDVAHYAKKKPFKTIGAAVISGLILGYFMHRD